MRSIAKLLIANRGEIAARIMRTAKAMDITCVVVYSDADSDAPFVQLADEAVRLTRLGSDRDLPTQRPHDRRRPANRCRCHSPRLRIPRRERRVRARLRRSRA